MTTKPWYRVQNAANSAVIWVYNDIGFGGVTADAFVRELAGIRSSTIELRINSGGGDVFEAGAIYAALRRHPAYIHGYVDGLAASAASFILMACDKVTVLEGSRIMIHEASAALRGDAAELGATSALLNELSNQIAGHYAARAGGTVAEWRERMRRETWYDADEAVAAGLADEVQRIRQRAVASLSASGALDWRRELREASMAGVVEALDRVDWGDAVKRALADVGIGPAPGRYDARGHYIPQHYASRR